MRSIAIVALSHKSNRRKIATLPVDDDDATIATRIARIVFVEQTTAMRQNDEDVTPNRSVDDSAQIRHERFFALEHRALRNPPYDAIVGFIGRLENTQNIGEAVAMRVIRYPYTRLRRIGTKTRAQRCIIGIVFDVDDDRIPHRRTIGKFSYVRQARFDRIAMHRPPP